MVSMNLWEGRGGTTFPRELAEEQDWKDQRASPPRPAQLRTARLLPDQSQGSLCGVPCGTVLKAARAASSTQDVAPGVRGLLGMLAQEAGTTGGGQAPAVSGATAGGLSPHSGLQAFRPEREARGGVGGLRVLP